MADSKQIIVFKVGEEAYGVPVEKVSEIVKMVKVSKLPDVSDYVEGIINLRGTVHVVYSLRTRFGMEKKEYDDNTKIILINGRNIGFIVDDVQEIIRIDRDESNKAENLPSIINKKYIASIVNVNDKIIIILSLDNILRTEEEDELDKISRRLK